MPRRRGKQQSSTNPRVATGTIISDGFAYWSEQNGSEIFALGRRLRPREKGKLKETNAPNVDKTEPESMAKDEPMQEGDKQALGNDTDGDADQMRRDRKNSTKESKSRYAECLE